MLITIKNNNTKIIQLNKTKKVKKIELSPKKRLI